MNRGEGKNKTDSIRKLLLETLAKSPDLFCYFAAIQEAKELLNKQEENTQADIPPTKPARVITDC